MTTPTKHQRLAALRPLSPESVASLAAAWDVRMVYESNAIEGSSLDLRETAMILKGELCLSSKPLGDIFSAVRLSEAWNRTKSGTSSGTASRLDSLRDLYTNSAFAEDVLFGRFDRSRSQRESFYEIKSEFFDLLNEVFDILDPVERAANIHFLFRHNDPFRTGSGRAARLAMNFVLLAAGYPPVSIPVDLRMDYYRALEAADSGDFQTWLHFLTTQLDHELDQWLSALDPSSPEN